MWTAEKFLTHISKGSVITRDDLRNVIVDIRESEYERGCVAMRKLYSELSKKRRQNKMKKMEVELNTISTEISDYVYKKRQESYYGEDGIDENGKKKENTGRYSENGTPKRTRRISGGKTRRGNIGETD